MLSEKFAGLAAWTKDNYRRVLRLAEHPTTLGEVPVGEIDAYLVQSFLDGLADRPGMQQRAKVALKAVERWAIVRRLLPRAITTGVEVIGSDGAREPWSDAEVDLAEAHARPELARVVTVAANTGQRIGDICALRWSQFESHRGHPGIALTQQKTGRRLWIPMTAELEGAVATWERRSVFVLTTIKGLQWKRTTLSQEWTRERHRNEALAPLEERKLSMHGLRATAVIRLRRAGVSRPLICDTIGMSMQMVERYCRRSDQADNALAAIEQMQRTRREQAEVVPFKRPALKA